VRNGGVVSAPITKMDAEPSMANPFAWRVVAETRDFYEVVEVHTLHDVVDSDTAATLYKPQVTAAVAAAKQSWLGRVYLDWAEFPVVTDVGNATAEGAAPPEPGWHTVEFQDLRFDHVGGAEDESRNPLEGWAYVGPRDEVEAMFMEGHEQKP
jgi:inner membrane protein